MACKPRTSGRAAPLASLVLWAAATAGCVSIDGGTVEVAWTIFAADARGSINDCSCADPAIAHVRLRLAPPLEVPEQADPCETDPSCVFSCGRKAGATHFTIPAASYLMSIEPVDADGTAIAADRVPAPILMGVTKGQHTDLGALEIVAPCAATCNGGDILAPCSGP